jgi:hypothetical protein
MCDMSPRIRSLRTVAILAVLISGLVLGGGGPASAGGGTTIGPVQINPVGHPHLCWQATGNGAPVLLETCEDAVTAQQWSLTPDGVMMNGIGYCLEARPGAALDIDFASQCSGSRGQIWRYDGTTGHLSSLGTCAALGGPVSSGTEVVGGNCPRGPRWSIGYGAVTLRPGTGSGPAGGGFDAAVTVANAASAQTAYEVTVAFGLLRGLDHTGVHATGGASGWRCSVLMCTGTLAAGASGQIGLSGRLPADARPGGSYTLTARAVVGGTSQLPGTARTTAPVTVSVYPAAPAPADPSLAGPSPGLVLLAGIVTVLLVGGGLLVGLTLRRRPARSTGYQARRRRPTRETARRG